MTSYVAVFRSDRLSRLAPLVGPVWSLGTGTGNDLVIQAAGVQQVHLRFREERFGWVVENLGGSLINGEALTCHRLCSGDQIQFGEVVVHFTSDGADPRLEVLDRESVDRLKNLFEAAGTLEPGSTEEVLSQALRELKAIFAVDRCMVLLRTNGGGQMVPVLAEGLDPASPERAISLSVARDVESSSIPLLIPDTSLDARYSTARSVMDHEIRTILCCPIVRRGQKLGVLYLDGRSPSRGFGQQDLHALELFCRHAARALKEGSDRQALCAQADQYRALSRDALMRVARLGDLTTRSEAMKQVIDMLQLAAVQEVGILLTGESGAGKEVLARAIHVTSPRRQGPFVAVNVAAVPRELIESELFGHEKAAFTGATEPRAGRLELADSGTLFLDEIGEMDPAMQVKLLRVLQDRRFERLGGGQTREANVRLIFATNADLKERVREGTFRQDLFYRVAAFPVRVPPLRERREDIPVIAEQILLDCSRRFGKTIRVIEPSALDLLASYPWPGNVRELKNVIERAVVLESSGCLRASTLRTGLDPLDRPEARPATDPIEEYPGVFEQARLEFDRRWLTHHLRKFGGNVSKTARHIGLSRVSLHKKISELGLKV